MKTTRLQVAVAGTRDWTLSKIRWSESVQNGPKTVDNGLKKSRMTKKYSALAIHLMQCIFQGFRYTLVVIQLCIYGVYYTRDCIFHKQLYLFNHYQNYVFLCQEA